MVNNRFIPDWDNKFNIGVEQVDLQHHYFLNLIKRLAIILNQDLSEYIIIRHISEIMKYADFHFQSEENMMLMENYPEFKNHEELHIDLMEEIGSFLNYYRKGEKHPAELIKFLVGWFINHTVVEDQKFGEYLKANNIQ